MTIALVLVAAVVLVALLIWLLFGAQKPKRSNATSALEIKALLPVHCRHLRQVRQVLSPVDAAFVRPRAPKIAVKQWRVERSRVLRLYAQGLAEDFQNLQQLARLISTLSPELARGQEWELLWAALQFRVLYRLTLVRLAMRGAMPLEQMARLTEIVAAVGFELESFLDKLTERLPQTEATPAI